MAVLSSKHTCAYFNVILKASKVYTNDIMWQHYDADFWQKAKATANTDWPTIDRAIFNLCFMGRVKQVQCCSNCNSIKHETTACPHKKDKQPIMATDTTLSSPKRRLEVCHNFNYHCPCHYTPCPYKHQCIKCFLNKYSWIAKKDRRRIQKVDSSFTATSYPSITIWFNIYITTHYLHP